VHFTLDFLFRFVLFCGARRGIYSFEPPPFQDWKGRGDRLKNISRKETKIMNITQSRELTRAERTAIRKLVITLCANYDEHYNICLLLDCACYMLNKCWTGSYCNYFRNAVLPNNPPLETALTGGGTMETRFCAFCGGKYAAIGKQKYCSAACAGKAQRKQQRDYMRKKRG